jgi:HPt (histidine-containing phosphotransfer) domain-containing protein
MKTQRTRFARYLALAIALTGLFAMAPAASAQYTNRNRDAYRNRGGLRSQSYERLRQWARELDERAEHANEQAQAQQAGYRGFRRDTNFLKSIDHFAERARGFRARIETYRTSPWDVDDELQHLLRDARTVQTRLRRARFADRHTAADWNQVVNLLNQMTTEYRAGIGTSRRYPSGDYRNDPYPNTVPYPNSGDYRTDPYPGDYRDDRGYGSYGTMTDLRQLAAELDQRAARASQLANGYSGYSSDITHFSEQAREFRDQVESNRMSRSELRSEVNHLLEDAQTAYSELRQRNVTRQVADEWDAIVQILNRMRALAV